MPRLLRRPTFWIVLVLVGCAGVFAFLRWRGPSVRTTLVVRRDLEEHIVSSGRVRVPQRVQIAAQTGGLVVAVGAVEGQRVSAGDLLVQIDDSAERAQVAQAEAAVNQAKARVDQLQRVGAIVATESLREAQSNLDRAQADLARTTKLVATQAVPQVELENAQRAVDIAQAQKNAAQAQQLASAPLGADSRIALTALLQAQAQLSGAKVRLAQARIVALQSGTVLTRSVEPGDVVQPSRTLLVLAADADVQLVVQPDERNVAEIQLGQKARAAADAYPQQPFDAIVSYIAPSIDPQRGSIEVRLGVPKPPPFLKPDMTVSVDLTVAAKPQVLTVPGAAVRGQTSTRPWVQIVRDDRVVRREVALGIRGEGSVEIVSGLAEGDEVIVPDGTQLADGARVRVERD
ncbi:MAG TPA: efflux RND transporter periplasmic adaptor subunit [Kofleriaceae bacterium]|nr:efflux RND transporter periplasmic adaptor subunit [Kofleriaceae bacterium]